MENPVTPAAVRVFAAEITDAVAESMLAGVWARARKIAPCLHESTTTLDDIDTELVKTIITSVVVRWHESGSGAVTQRGAGDFSETLSGYSGGLFRPDEIRDLQQMCSEFRAQSASTIPVGGYEPVTVQHAGWCSINFGATYCDCGAELTATGLPLWTRTP